MWKLPRPPEDTITGPVAVPALLLAGDYDTVTPGYQADALAAAFRTAEIIRVRGAGHGVLAVSGCAGDAVADFLEAPGSKIENTCAEPPESFATVPVATTAVPVPVAAAGGPATAAVANGEPGPPAPTGPPAPQVAAVAPPPETPGTPSPISVPVPPPPPAAVSQPMPTVTPVACPFPSPSDVRMECGTVAVPQWHELSASQPAGPTVVIFFAITRASGPAPRPDPVLVLNGGPGQPATDLIDSGWERMAELRRSRDILYVDQRGTGHSQPGLYCRDLNPVAFWHGGLTTADAEGCLKPIQAAGYDIAAFNTVESAADLVAVRRALGISQWNLLGTSYGTALAMELVRRDDAAVRSVVLNSPTTIRASWLDLQRMAAIREVYRRLFADCAADTACNGAYPDLEAVFLDLATRMTNKPLPVTYQDPRSGATIRTQMNFANLLDILTIMVGSGAAADRVPALLWHLHQVTLGRQPARPELLSWLYMPYWQTMNAIAYGLNAAIGCREIRPWIDVDRLRREGSAYQPYVVPQAMEQDYDVFCPAWHLPRGPEELRQPVTGAVPTLLLTGDYDTLTPTGLADIIASTLSKARVLRFHAIGHDVFATSACGRAAAAHFIATPDDPITLPCLQSPRVPQFVARRAS